MGFEIIATIVLLVLIITIPSLIIIFIVNYVIHIPKERQIKIKYSDFIKWISVEKEYNFDHTNWHFETYGPCFGYCCASYYCYFNFFDYCRYRIFHLKLNRKKEKDDMSYRRLRIIQHIDKDIQNSTKNNNEE